MNHINIFYDYLILIPAITFVITVFLKWLFIKIKTWKFDISLALWSWWMPSVHSSSVVSLSTAIVLKHWIESDLFAITMAYTMIIIYDAINVRFEAWQHAWALNNFLWTKRFKESLWHLPSEAFAWSLLWIFVAIFIYYL